MSSVSPLQMPSDQQLSLLVDVYSDPAAEISAERLLDMIELVVAGHVECLGQSCTVTARGHHLLEGLRAGQPTRELPSQIDRA